MKKSFLDIKRYLFQSFPRAVTAKAVFFAMGIVSTLWFLIRVIPKPGRASYPCMRAAAPIMSSFIIWVLSLFGMTIAFRKFRVKFAQSKYFIAALCLFAFLFSTGLFFSQSIATLYANTVADAVIGNAAVGAGRGIFPGRVAWVHNTNAAKWTGAGNYWDPSVNPQAEYNKSFSLGLQSLSGGANDADSWYLIFKWFNGSHGRPGTGYESGDKIAIKINQNNTPTPGANQGNTSNGNPQTCVACIQSLVNAGVPQGDIWIGDPARAVTDNIFNAIHSAFPGVHVVDYFGNNGRETTPSVPNVFPNNDVIPNEAKCFYDARYIINTPLLKGHVGQAITFGAKNFYGLNGIKNIWQNNGGRSPHISALTNYFTNANFGGKTILWCMDAMYPNQNLDGTPQNSWAEAPFNGKPAASFFMSLDGVAEESVSLDFFYQHYAGEVNTNGGMANAEGYMINAANAGAGVHEHWNNNVNRQYSRNLNPMANGIELVYVCASCDIPVVAITSPLNNAVYTPGSSLTITGTASTPSGTVTTVQVFDGTTLLGTATGTTSWSFTWPNVPFAPSHILSAVATNNLSATGSSPAVTIIAPIQLPAKVEAESYTAMQGIQTEPTTDAGGGMNVGYTDATDFIDFLVKVPTTASYSVDLRIASNVNTGAIQIKDQLGNVLATYAQETATGGWQIWETHTVTVNLTAGVQTLRIYWLGGGLNLNWFQVRTNAPSVLTTIAVTPATAAITVGNTQQYVAVGKDQNGNTMAITPTWSASGGTISSTGLFTGTTTGTFTITAQAESVTGTAQATVGSGPVGTPVPGVIQAEGYSAMLGIQTQPTTDLGGGQNVGYIDTGDWMTYLVTVGETGSYTIKFRVAGWAATGRIALQDASNTTLTAANVPNSGGYQMWTTVAGESSFTLTAGTQTIRIFATSAPWNLNWFQIDSVAPSVLTSISVTPATVTLGINATQQFTAVGKDQNNNTMSISPNWSATNGTISATGLYTAGATTGSSTITAQSGSVTGTAIATISSVTGPVVPGKIEAEAFSAMQGVQLEPTTDTGGGQNVGYIDPTDWMDYNVSVAAAGTYKASFRVASGGATGAFQLKIGATVIATVAVPNTGGWQKWQTVSTWVTLPQAAQTLRILATGAGFNLNWLNFSSSMKIEAESYTAMQGIQTEATTDIGGGLNVGYTNPTDYMDYSVNVPVTDSYVVDFRVASNVGTGALQLRNPVGTPLASLAQGTTGGWQNWVTKGTTVNLTAGVQTLRIYYTGAGLNLNWFALTPTTGNSPALE